MLEETHVNTPFYEKSYKAISEIKRHDVIYLSIKWSIDIISNETKKDIIDEKYSAVLTGPFIHFNSVKINTKNESKDFSQFYIFSCNYAIRRLLDKVTLEMVPIIPTLNSKFFICFDSVEKCSDWHLTMMKVRRYLCEPPKVFLPILMGVKVSGREWPCSYNYEMSFLNQTLTLRHVQKNSPELKSINLDSTFLIFSSYEFSSVSFNERLISFCIRFSNNEELIITCESYDLMLFSFTTLYLRANLFLIESRMNKSIKSTVGIVNEEIDLLCNQTTKYQISICQKQTPYLSFSAPSVFKSCDLIPKKASSELEILFFEKSVNRRVYYCDSTYLSKCHLFKHNETHLYDTCFQGLINELSNMLDFSIPEIALKEKNLKRIPFQITKEPLSIPYHLDGNQIFHSFEYHYKIPSEIIQISKENGVKIEPNLSFFIGHSIIQRLSLLVANMVDETFINNIKEISELLHCIVFHQSNENIFFEQFTDLGLPKDMNGQVLTKNKSIRTSQFIKRILYLKSIQLFLSAVIRHNHWRISVYGNFALMRNPEFIEMLQATLKPLDSHNRKMLIVPSFSTSNSSPIPCYEMAFMICNRIIQIYHSNSFIDECQALVLTLVSSIVSFFEKDYRAPLPSLFPNMRHCFYVFQVACTLEIESAEMMAMRATIEIINQMEQQKPELSLKNLLITGIKCGMAHKWIIYALKAAKIENLYKKEANTMNINNVTILIHALFLLSKVLFPNDLSIVN